jgi:hypothetical protein
MWHRPAAIKLDSMEGDEHRPDGGCGTRFNVIAAFAQDQDANVALDALTSGGVPRSAIKVHRPDDGSAWAEVVELEAEMGDEVGDSWGVLSGAQAKGAFVAALTLGVAGIVLGLAAGLVWSYVFPSGVSRPVRVVLAASVLGLAGATIGLVAGGGGLGRQQGGGPDRGDQPEMAERDVLVTVQLEDPGAAVRTAGLLRGLGAERVHFIDVDGIPLPRQVQHPRPADPEDWWWRNAGHG